MDNITNIIEQIKYDYNLSVYDGLHGNCLIFANLLKELVGGEIIYIPNEFHFVLRNKGKLYDIRGNVTNLYIDEHLAEYEDIPTKILNQFLRS